MAEPDFPWMSWPETEAVVAALGAEQMRFVGGAVRDSLLGLPVADIDIATTLLPEDVANRARAAKLKAIPTGIAHGTVTIVAQHRAFEVTTLRQDISTDGRRATVAFTQDWRADAARRDFTLNALYLDSNGRIHDYFGGLEDARARRVRFIGDASDRIREDALRILRFFRFSARYADLPLDAAGLAACIARARDMMSLSRERIRDEFLKLLGAPCPLPVLQVMLEAQLISVFLPEITSLERLTRLLHRESLMHMCDPLRRLLTLLPASVEHVDAVSARLKFSNAQRKRMLAAAIPQRISSQAELRSAIYRFNAETAEDCLLLGETPEAELPALLALARQWQVPHLPISGKHLIAAGILPGPDVTAAVQWFETEWIARGFPADQESIDALVKAAAARWTPCP